MPGKESGDRITVAFLPYQGPGNPYQLSLHQGLSLQGVDVLPEPPPIWFLLRLLRLRGRVVAHLHWLHPYILAPGRPVKSLVKTALFVGQLLALRLLGIRIIWTAHNLKAHEPYLPWLDRFATACVARLSHGIIAHCSRARGLLLRQFPGVDPAKVSIVPHGHFLECYPNAVSGDEARRRLALDRRQTVFLFLGNVRPYKGVLDLVEAFRSLPEEHLVLIVAGDTPDPEHRKVVQEAVREDPRIRFFPEFLPGDQVQVYMNAADVVVLPYVDVLTSGAAVLAMGFARPCIAARRGCLPETLHPQGVVLYEPRQEGALVAALRHAIERKDDLAEMGQRNLQLVRTRDWRRIGAAVVTVYGGETVEWMPAGDPQPERVV